MDNPRVQFGVDLNRNFGYLWSNNGTGVCEAQYPGDQPFSEPETRAIRVRSNKIEVIIVDFLQRIF